jgi:hypothetical protein
MGYRRNTMQLDNFYIQDFEAAGRGLKVNYKWYEPWKVSSRKVFRIPFKSTYVIVKIGGGTSQSSDEAHKYSIIDPEDKKYFAKTYSSGEIRGTSGLGVRRRYEYIVMEYIDFEELSVYIENIPTEVFDLVEYLCEKYFLVDVSSDTPNSDLSNWVVAKDHKLYIIDYAL